MASKNKIMRNIYITELSDKQIHRMNESRLLEYFKKIRGLYYYWRCQEIRGASSQEELDVLADYYNKIKSLLEARGHIKRTKSDL